jgi:hypothetical protein
MTSMTNPTLGSNRSRAVFLAWWLLTTSFGWILVAVPITFLITPTSGRFVGEEGIVFIFAYLYVVPSLGIMVASFLQWLLLRIYIRQSILWAILSVIGWIVGVTVVATLLSGIGRVVANLLPAFGQTPLDFLMVPIGGSLVCGILQWILIRKKIARSALWILASIVAWFLANMALTIPLRRLIPQGPSEGVAPPSMAYLFMISVIPAVITGITMTLLLSRNPQASHHPGAA